MNILEKTSSPKDFDWFDYNDYPASVARRFEIYSRDDSILNEVVFKKLALEILCYNSVDIKIGLSIKDSIWGGFTSDVWKMKENDFVFYPFGELSNQTERYLKLLIDSQIDFEYKGFCQANDLSAFIDVIADCVINNIAPYSPLFFQESTQTIFYLHHTFSLGCYTKSLDMARILEDIGDRFDVHYQQYG